MIVNEIFFGSPSDCEICNKPTYEIDPSFAQEEIAYAQKVIYLNELNDIPTIVCDHCAEAYGDVDNLIDLLDAMMIECQNDLGALAE